MQKAGCDFNRAVTRVSLTDPMVYLKGCGPGLVTIPVSESQMQRKLSGEVTEEDISIQTSALHMHPSSQVQVCAVHRCTATLTYKHT